MEGEHHTLSGATSYR